MDSLLNLLYRALARASHRSFYVLMSKASEQHFPSAFYGTTLLLHTTQIPKGSGNPPRLVLYLVNFGDCRFRWNRLSIEMASPGGRQQGNVQIRKYHVERILASLDRQQAYIQIRFGSQPLTPAVEQNSLYSLYYARYFSPCAQGDYPNYLGGHSSQPLLIYLPSKMCCVLSESYPPPSTSRIACHVECTTKLAILGILLHRVHFLLHPFPMALGSFEYGDMPLHGLDCSHLPGILHQFCRLARQCH